MSPVKESTSIKRTVGGRIALLAAMLLALATWVPAAHALNFSAPSILPVGSEPQSVVVDHFNINNDSYPDLVVANEAQKTTSAGSVMVFLGSASGSFTNSATIPFSNRRPTDIAVDDFNGDSRSDLAVVNFNTDNVSVLLGNGNGTFGPRTDLPAVPHGSPVSIKSSHFNNDTAPDLVVVNEGSDYTDPACQTAPCPAIEEPGSVSVFLGAGNGSFSTLPKFGSFRPVRSLQSVAVGRFDGDTHADLALVQKVVNKVVVASGAGNGTFGGSAGYTVGTEPSAVAIGQFTSDLDSYPDIVATNEFDHDVSMLRGSAAGAFADAVRFSAPQPVNEPVSVAVDHLNADTYSDLVVTNIRSDNVSVLLGGAGGTFVGTNFTVGDGPTSTAVGDFNGDTYRDIAVTNEISDNVTILFATAPETTIDSAPPAITNNLTPTFNFSSSDPFATYQCRLAGPGLGSGSFSSCTSPKSYTFSTAPSSIGDYTFQVQAIDDAGRVDRTPAVWRFTFDTTPTLTDTMPRSPANDNNPRVRGTASAGTTVRLYNTLDCSGTPVVSGSAAEFSSAGFPVSVRDDTSTEFYADARDSAGNVSGCSPEPVIYVEVSPPPPPDPGPSPGGVGPPGPGGPGGGNPGGSPITVDVTGPAMAIAGRSVKLKASGAVALPVSCPASEPGGCAGNLSLETVVQVKAGKRKIKLGRSSFRIGGGRNGSVKLRLSPSNRRLVKKLKRIRVLVVINARDQVGNAKTIKKTLTLKA